MLTCNPRLPPAAEEDGLGQDTGARVRASSGFHIVPITHREHTSPT